MNPAAVAGALGGFGMFAPGLAEVRHMDPSDPDAVADVRLGELFGLSWSFVIVLLVAAETGSWRPLGYWAVGATALLVLWEAFLRTKTFAAQEG